EATGGRSPFVYQVSQVFPLENRGRPYRGSGPRQDGGPSCHHLNFLRMKPAIPTSEVTRAAWDWVAAPGARPQLLARPVQYLKDLAIHQEGNFGGRQRLLAFGQRIEPEIGIGQHFEQIACGGSEACLGLLDIIGYAFLRREGGVPRHALKIDRGDAEPFLKFE